MRERSGSAGILEKPGMALGIRNEILSHHPEGNGPSVLRIARPVKLADAAGADPFEDFVLPKRLEH
jgi:hypothetical protein